MKLHYQRRGVDAEQVQVKKGVEICTQQQPITWMIVLNTPVGLDVGCLKERQKGTPRHGTTIAKTRPQSVTELLLSATGTNLPLDKFAAINACWKVANVFGACLRREKLFTLQADTHEPLQ